MSLPAQGVAVVTGASSGIGAAYAERLAQRGYDLTIVDGNRKRLDALAARISDHTGRAVEVFVADLGRLEDLVRIETTLKRDASVTMLVNNAGIGAVTPLLQSNADVMEEMIKLNVVALTRLTYALAPMFVARGHGTIINIASVAAIAPEIANGVYGATKAYVLAFSQSLHHELADKGIRVQVVMPEATAFEFCKTASTPPASRPAERVTPAADVVDAALAGLDAGDLVTIPSLRDIADWNALEAARRKLAANLSRAHAAARYKASMNTGSSTRH